MKGQGGFTLLEVLVAFALLASLLTLILQTQGEQAFFMSKINNQEKVRQELEEQVLALERGDQKLLWKQAQGTFETGHPLAGYRFQRQEQEELLLGQIPVNRATLSISWTEREHPQTYQISFYAPQQGF